MKSLCLLLVSVVGALAADATSDHLAAVAWVQTSAEYAATSVQTYRSAERALLRALEDVKWTAALEQQAPFAALPPAVILDLDETVIDNSPSQAELIHRGAQFSNESWTKWIAQERAGLVPGALRFLNEAHARGVALFYVTNRQCKPADPADHTANVVRKLSIPLQAGRLLCRTSNDGDKGPRRAHVASSHRVLLVIGDDLNDFVSLTKERSSVEARETLWRAYESYWGERWFMLANPMYGSWERAVGMEGKAKLQRLRR